MADLDVDYLQPGFDPKTVTVPRLRSIMVTHNIAYNSAAKKSDLVALFHREIAPMAQRLLAQRARVKRMSSGIINAGEERPEEFEDSMLRPPSRSSRRSVSPRKSAEGRRVSGRGQSESVEPESRPTSSRSMRVTRHSASRGASVDPEHEATPRANKRMSGAPQVFVQQPSQDIDSEEDSDDYDESEIPSMLSEGGQEKSVFTDDNPFQSGSPPRAKRKSVGPINTKRKSLGPSAEPSPVFNGPTLSSIMAQREPPPQFTSPRVSSPREQSSPYGTSSYGGSPYQSSPYQSSQYHNSPYQNSPFQPLPRMRTPSSDMKRIPSPVPLAQRGLSPSPAPRRSPSPGPFPEYQDDIYAGEEFTPEEQEELEAEEAVIRTNVAPPRPASRGFDFTTPIYVLLSTILIAYAIWYRQEKIAVGYCGLGREATQILPPDLPVPDVLLPFVEPQCEPCPAHAYCYEDFVVRCDTDFVAKPHPLSFGGLIPIPPTCEPDGEKVVRVKAVADKVIEELRVRRAKHECGETVEETGERVEPAIKEKALKELINRQRRKTLGQQEFDELWDAAIGEVKNADEVDVSQAATHPGDIPDTYLSSTSLSKLPFSCAVRHAVLSGLERHRRVLGGVIGALLVVLYITRRIRQRRTIRAQVPGLVDVVLERLATQRETCDEEYDDPWLFLPNLRDDVLRGIHQLGQREKIWKFVVPVVEQNANVRTAQRESRAGEVGRAWEWIGPIRGEVVARRKAAGIEKDKEAYGNADRPIC